MDFKLGQRVKVVQRGSLLLGSVTITDSTFVGVTVARKNADGSYGIFGIISTGDIDIVDVPADWIEPL